MSDESTKGDPKQPELDLTPEVEVTPLPPLVPPKTDTPFQLNQQINIQQIPPKVWDKLSAEQIYELSKTILSKADEIDNRHFQFAMEKARRDGVNAKLAMSIGALITLVGFAAATYLAKNENQVIAGIIATFLATILSVVLGSRIIKR